MLPSVMTSYRGEEAMLGWGGENLPYYVALSSIRCYRIEAIVDCLYYSLKLGGGGGAMPPPPPNAQVGVGGRPPCPPCGAPPVINRHQILCWWQ